MFKRIFLITALLGALGCFTHTASAQQPVNQAQVGGTAIVADPCQSSVKSYGSNEITASTQLITGTSAKHTYICSINVISATAETISIVEGTGSVCATGVAKVAGMDGGNSTSTGWSFAANGGLTLGNGGSAVGEAANATADNVCVLVSGAGQVNIGYSYVQQ